MKAVAGSCNLKLIREGQNHEDLIEFLVAEDMYETMIFGIDNIRRMNLIAFITSEKKMKRKKKRIPRTEVITEAKVTSEVQRENSSKVII